jgi:Toxin SymE, type I toxin-antitoxin system
VQEVEPPKPVETPVRKLKIEASGDFWKGLIKPKIRLTGRWLEEAGFRPGSRVHVTCIAPGVIELRSCGELPAREPEPPLEEPNCPF